MKKHLSAFALCAVATALSAPVAAEDAAVQATVEPVSVEHVALFNKTVAMDDGQLAQFTGREDLNQQNNSDQSNAVKNNSVGDNSKTGVISIADNAFQNMNGFSILNANTGNNVAINAAILVNISLPSGK